MSKIGPIVLLVGNAVICKNKSDGVVDLGGVVVGELGVVGIGEFGFVNVSEFGLLFMMICCHKI